MPVELAPAIASGCCGANPPAFDVWGGSPRACFANAISGFGAMAMGGAGNVIFGQLHTGNPSEYNATTHGVPRSTQSA